MARKLRPENVTFESTATSTYGGLVWRGKVFLPEGDNIPPEQLQRDMRQLLDDMAKIVSCYAEVFLNGEGKRADQAMAQARRNVGNTARLLQRAEPRR